MLDTSGTFAQVCGTGLVGLRVRDEPSTSGEVTGWLGASGTPIRVIDGPVVADGYDWYRVHYDAMSQTLQQSGEGWVAGEFLTDQADVRDCGGFVWPRIPEGTP